MRALYVIIGILFSITAFGQSQSHEFTIDYTVKYLIDNAKEGTKDTITIGYEKNGKYLWTNFKRLTEELASDIMPGLRNIPDGASNFVYASEDNKIYMSVFLGPINMMMDMDMALVLQGTFSEDDKMNEEIVLESKQTLDPYRFNDKEYPKYEVYAAAEPDKPIIFAVDESKKMNNSALLINFMKLMISATESSGGIQGGLPEGIILSIIDDNGVTLLEAIDVNIKPRKISLNNSFKISE
ncbi:hypothetical protein [uncultured Dokdonia sp.]|uniref:hypothetical protein n=1 Tax=uncultured Dokdonia sp. TaxID=575653 RepID=UPI00261BE4AC|nr:hypothetical protein [uncultured Dokdonia sp.]